MSETPRLQFLGGAETVTGSKTLIETDTTRLLVDCGLFQGIKKRRNRNWNPLPVDAASIDHVVLTHGHLDHVGYLPRLVREGFNGRIHATTPTLDVAKVILKDSAKIQEEDAERANREGFTDHDPAEPLYTVGDAKETFRYFEQHEPRQRITLSGKLAVKFVPNGHILGSTFVSLEVADRTLVFSGDLGRPESILHTAPEVPDTVDQLVLESTYGDRLHLDVDPAEQLQEVVTDTVGKGGNLIVPSFALGRAQELMYLLNELKDQQRIPDLPVFLDSPMGVDMTELYGEHSEWHKLSSEEIRKMCRGIELIRDFDRTRTVLQEPGSKIIIAGSGMLSGGRVLYYLKRLLDRTETTILLTGFQAEGTRGRLLQEGAHELKFHGKYYPVKADVRELTNLSAHADQAEILEWLERLPEDPDRLFINHGEPQASQALRVKVSDDFGWPVDVVEARDTFSLNMD